MTATPRIIGARAGRAGERALASMDDPAIFGPVLHRLGFAEAIRRGLLCDYEVLVVGVGDGDLAGDLARRALVSTPGGEITDLASLAKQVALLGAITRYDLRRVISFHTRVAGAQRTARELMRLHEARAHEHAGAPAHKPVAARELIARPVSARMNAAERARRLRQLSDPGEDRRVVLTNARCLAEGIDIPAVDGIAFMDPRSSQVDIVQAVGRVMRRSERHKRIGRILVPVFIASGEDDEQVLAGSDFARVWQVVRALRAHDETLAEELDQARSALGRSGGPGPVAPSRVRFDLPADAPAGLAQMLSVRLVRETSSAWDENHGLLSAFVSERGRMPRQSEQYRDERIGRWVNHQRRAAKGGSLSPARRARLEAIPGWVWDERDAAWEESWALLRAFVGEHRRMPRFAEEHGGVRLGFWVSTQRRAAKEATIAPERRARLEAIPGWVWDEHDAAWEANHALLCEFAREKGRMPSAVECHRGARIGGWVHEQRKDQRQGVLSQERRARLEEVPGWIWGTRRRGGSPAGTA